MTQPPAGARRRTAVAAVAVSAAGITSRLAGLAREIVAARAFGVSGTMSAFTVAFQVPGLVRALVADWALQAAFIPVFTDLVERDRRREAMDTALALFTIVTLGLGAATAVFVLAAPVVMPLFAPGLADDSTLRHLTVTLSQIMFPIVPLLAISGLIVSILNSYGKFVLPALTQVVWNGIVLVALLVGPPLLSPGHAIYAYAVGVLVATAIQVVLPWPWLRRLGFSFGISFACRNPHVTRVLKNMLPVTIAMGATNVNLVLNSLFGSLVSPAAPAAIDKAIRVYAMPQSVIAEAVGIVLFPSFVRLATRGNLRELARTISESLRVVFVLVMPAAVWLAVLAEPITRLVYERGAFGAGATELVSGAMVWWGLALPFDAANSILVRALFGLQRVWSLAAITGTSFLVNVGATYALYRPLGIGGIVLGTVAAMAFVMVAYALLLRRTLGGLDAIRIAASVFRSAAGAGVLGAVSYGTWVALDPVLGRSVGGQLVALGLAMAAGLAAYLVVLRLVRAPELRSASELIRRRR